MKQNDSCHMGEVDWMKDGKGINQRVFMYDPWTWTIVWGLAEGGVRVGLCGGEQREKKQGQL